jgi:hypothetical protein
VEYHQGIEFLYDWEFEKAEDLFKRIIRGEPTDLKGYFYFSVFEP